MYSLFSSCLLQCCPNGGLPFVPILRNNRCQNEEDDDFEKYVPRPKIVIDRRDCELTRTYIGDSFEPTTPVLRVAAQYLHKKNTIIIKVISLHACDLSEDDVSQVRVLLSDQKTKQQTAIVRGQEPTFNQTFSFSGVDRDALMMTTLRFRVYSRTGKSRMNLRAEASLEGERLSQYGQIPYTLTLSRINTIKSEVPLVRK